MQKKESTRRWSSSLRSASTLTVYNGLEKRPTRAQRKSNLGFLLYRLSCRLENGRVAKAVGDERIKGRRD